MQGREFWQKWAFALDRLGLRDMAAVLLDAGGPLAVVASQAVYFGHPLLSVAGSSGEWDALAALLENPDESRNFVAYLREEERA